MNSGPRKDSAPDFPSGLREGAGFTAKAGLQLGRGSAGGYEQDGSYQCDL